MGERKKKRCDVLGGRTDGRKWQDLFRKSRPWHVERGGEEGSQREEGELASGGGKTRSCHKRKINWAPSEPGGDMPSSGPGKHPWVLYSVGGASAEGDLKTEGPSGSVRRRRLDREGSPTKKWTSASRSEAWVGR